MVRYGDADVTVPLADRAAREHTVTLDVARAQGPTRLDLHFLLDTTGSMGDEIGRLQKTLDSVAALATFRTALAKASAGGGGDTPEALDEALHGAVNGPSWDSERAVQIAFLVADAAPHLGASTGPSYAKDVRVVVAQGVEVVPLAPPAPTTRPSTSSASSRSTPKAPSSS